MVARKEPTTITFYLYRAQSGADYPLENVNLANLPGVLLYFHHEIFMDCDRDADGKVVYPVRHKFGITRFLRFKITMKSTRETAGSARSIPASRAISRRPSVGGSANSI